MSEISHQKEEAWSEVHTRVFILQIIDSEKCYLQQSIMFDFCQLKNIRWLPISKVFAKKFFPLFYLLFSTFLHLSTLGT